MGFSVPSRHRHGARGHRPTGTRNKAHGDISRIGFAEAGLRRKSCGLQSQFGMRRKGILRYVPVVSGSQSLAAPARVAPVLCDAGGNWTADYIRPEFAAIKP